MKTRRAVVALAVVAGLAVAVPVAVWVMWPSGSEVASDTEPTTVSTVIDPAELPAIDSGTAAATLAYLDGEGAPLLELVLVAEAQAGPLDTTGCSQARAQLTESGSPAELGVLADRVPDEVVRAAVDGARSSLVAVLQGCQSGGEYGDASLQALESAALFEQRLAQLKAA